jgi:hypothetical protein
LLEIDGANDGDADGELVGSSVGRGVGSGVGSIATTSAVEFTSIDGSWPIASPSSVTNKRADFNMEVFSDSERIIL